MRHVDRWDIPKGHVDAGETDMQCALRELWEETGIAASDIDVVPDFQHVTQYVVRGRRDGQPHDKTLVVFLARLINKVEIKATEHPDFRWFPWQPPHKIQERTIDPLLAAAERYLASSQ